MGEVSIATARTRDDAEIISGLLESAGIAARVIADDAGGAYPFSLDGGVEIVVDGSDRDAAMAVLSAAPETRS